MSQDLEEGLDFAGGGGYSFRDDDAQRLEKTNVRNKKRHDLHQSRGMHHYSHEKSNEEEHASHCNHDKESSCTLRKVVTADVEHNHQSDEANMKLGGLKRSFAHYSPWNTDDDIMQARRPVATTEYAAAPSTTDAFSSSKAFFRKELVPAQQYLHTTGGGIECKNTHIDSIYICYGYKSTFTHIKTFFIFTSNERWQEAGGCSTG
jgi:hypothetical protein